MRLTPKMLRVLRALGREPVQRGITNPTMAALESRGLAKFSSNTPALWATWIITDAGRNALASN